MKRFWVSWIQPGEDCRPLTYPPNSAVLGWWKSGYRLDGEDEGPALNILCALVSAPNEKSAREAVSMDWPDLADWRFMEEKELDWTPASDRFPPSEWMMTRLAGMEGANANA
jgi:hypothetical protein